MCQFLVQEIKGQGQWTRLTSIMPPDVRKLKKMTRIQHTYLLTSLARVCLCLSVSQTYPAYLADMFTFEWQITCGLISRLRCIWRLQYQLHLGLTIVAVDACDPRQLDGQPHACDACQPSAQSLISLLVCRIVHHVIIVMFVHQHGLSK